MKKINLFPVFIFTFSLTFAHNKSTLERERPSMYAALLEKLEELYNKP